MVLLSWAMCKKGHAPPPRKFWKFESLKWPFPAFCYKFRTCLILIFASKLRFCKKKKFRKGGRGAQPSPPPPFGSATAGVTPTCAFIVPLLVTSTSGINSQTFLSLIFGKFWSGHDHWLIQLDTNTSTNMAIYYFVVFLLTVNKMGKIIRYHELKLWNRD